MQFYVPLATKRQQEDVYTAIVKLFEDQMRWTVQPRRIQSLKYLHDKKHYTAEVGKMDPSEGRYQVMAILESNYFVVYSRAAGGEHGTSILVNKSEVYELTEFEG